MGSIKSDIRKLINTNDKLTQRVTMHLLNGGSEVDFTESRVRETMVKIMSTPFSRERGWHPSTLMGCKRAQVFEYMGMDTINPFTAEQINLFNDGKWRHLRWQTMGLTAGFLDEVEVGFKTSDNLVGSVDGKGVDRDGVKFIFELKGIYQLNDSLPYSLHVWQVQSYLYGNQDCKYATIVYEDKRTQHFREYVVKRKPYMQKVIKSRLESLNQHVSNKELPDVREECRAGKGEEFKECPYKNVCLKLRSWGEAETEAGKEPF
jgi:hypothetical protein